MCKNLPTQMALKVAATCICFTSLCKSCVLGHGLSPLLHSSAQKHFFLHFVPLANTWVSRGQQSALLMWLAQGPGIRFLCFLTDGQMC